MMRLRCPDAWLKAAAAKLRHDKCTTKRLHFVIVYI
jgi:hypothetical protein